MGFEKFGKVGEGDNAQPTPDTENEPVEEPVEEGEE